MPWMHVPKPLPGITLQTLVQNGDRRNSSSLNKTFMRRVFPVDKQYFKTQHSLPAQVCITLGEVHGPAVLF